MRRAAGLPSLEEDWVRGLAVRAEETLAGRDAGAFWLVHGLADWVEDLEVTFPGGAW